MEFGDVEAYKKIKGRIHFAIDPKVPEQAGIRDVEPASVNA